jgi:hypothetical protein
MINKYLYNNRDEQRGAVAVIVALLLLFVLIPIGALVVDLAFRYVAKNELQSAADAGSLAGARILFENPNIGYNVNAKNIAREVAINNFSMGNPVEVEIDEDDVQLGHWSFGFNGSGKIFTPYDDQTLIIPSDLINYIVGLNSPDENHIVLDTLNGEDAFFINAVKVSARRDNLPVPTFFSKIFGLGDRPVIADAVAYMGSSGSWYDFDFDYPIAICQESLSGDFCSIGRMLEDDKEGDSAQWTNFTQPCQTANPSNMDPLFTTCGTGNPESLSPGNMGTTWGVSTPNMKKFEGCWISENDDNLFNCNPSEKKSYDTPTEPWSMTLPVIQCTENQPNCRPLVSAINVNVLWILLDGVKHEENAPCKMGAHHNYPAWNSDSDCANFELQIGKPTAEAITNLNTIYDVSGWSSSRWQGESTYEESMARWDCFVNHYGIVDPSGNPAPFTKKTVYFAPNCTDDEIGSGGGEFFFGVFSERPVLVQ